METMLLAIERSGLAELVGGTPSVYPIVSALHIIGIAVLFGSILIVDLKMLGAFQRSVPESTVVLLVRMAVLGFTLALLSGLVLFSVQALKYASNVAFQTKFVLLGLAVTNAFTAKMMMSTDNERRCLSSPLAISAAVSVILWVAVIMAGRWIAFV